MLGYVTTEKAQLKMIEYEIYGGYYCGVCKSIGRRYGQLPRMVLSYDAAFLAVMLASLEEEPDEPKQEHCIIHRIKKKTIVSNAAVDYAGDVMLILAWYKLLDDAVDEGKIYAKATIKTMKHIYKKLQKKRPKLCEAVRMNLGELSELEKAKCDNLDMVAEAFARIMQIIFIGYKADQSEVNKKVLARIGYHLGKWIYLMDAFDDIEDNIKSGAYNPLIYRYQYKEDSQDFKLRIKEDCRRNLLIYLSEIGKSLDLLDIKKNEGILENIVYMGLLRRTEKLLDGEPETKKT